MAGQTINDRLLAARHSIAGQGLAKSVCKATTEEMIAPKKKHLDCKYCYGKRIYWSIFLKAHNYFFVQQSDYVVATATLPMVDNIFRILNVIRDDRIQVHRTRILFN